MTPSRIVRDILWRAYQGEPPAAIAAAVQCQYQTVEEVLAKMRPRLKRTAADCAPSQSPRRQGRRSLDLAGQRFTRLVAVAPVGKNKWNQMQWRCRCDCGGETTVTAGDFRRGLIQSCGCLRKDYLASVRGAGQLLADDLVGKRYGRLIVTAREANALKHTRWRCRCDCGAETVVYGSALKQGRTKSCGCLRKEGSPGPRAGTPRQSTAMAGRPGRDAPRFVKAPVRGSSRGFSEDEQAQIQAAIEAGKLERIEQGEWPDAGRHEILKWQSPIMRRALPAKGQGNG